jgi:hypothetical protein
MLTDSQLRHATRANPGHARSLGWDRWIADIGVFLGEASVGAGDARLAQKVERFQYGHPPLDKDGVIGARTWLVLKKAIEEKPPRIVNPNAPPPRDSKPTPERIKALNDWLVAMTEGHPRSADPWTFYEEIDSYLGPFGDSGYPIGYGKKYCKLFNENKVLAQHPQARAWVRRTTILLQTYLTEFIVDRYRKGTLGSLTEKELRDAAFASHPRAYTQGGLTYLMMMSPELQGVLSAIPDAEFHNENADASEAQYRETRSLVIREAIGSLVAGLTIPLARAAEKDRLEFQQRIQLSQFLTDLKSLIEAGQLDRIVWLESATRQVERIEFPNTGLKKFAGEVVAAADARKKALAASYRQDIRLVPALQAEYNTYDPGWSRW